MDDVARAVGASGSAAVTIAGKECRVRPLGIRELTEVERDCLDRYRRQYLETYQGNLDLLPEGQRAGLMARKLDEVGRWDVDTLPPRFAHDAARIKLTAELREWLISHWSLEGAQDDARLQRLAAASLDQGSLNEVEYRQLTGGALPPRVKVPYVHWWITGSYDGMVTLIWACFRRDGVTREQVAEYLGEDLTRLSELSREIEKLSAPQAGNG